MIGGTCGLLALIIPEITGGGFSIIPCIRVAGGYSLTALLLFLLRTIHHHYQLLLRLHGGIFAPIALGTLFGSAFWINGNLSFPDYQIQIGALLLLEWIAFICRNVKESTN